MSYRRALIALIVLALAGLACNLGSSGTSVPPTSAPVASKTPVSFHNGGVTPEDNVTQEATQGKSAAICGATGALPGCPSSACRPTRSRRWWNACG